jgi:hypothetical protein
MLPLVLTVTTEPVDPAPPPPAPTLLAAEPAEPPGPIEPAIPMYPVVRRSWADEAAIGLTIAAVGGVLAYALLPQHAPSGTRQLNPMITYRW